MLPTIRYEEESAKKFWSSLSREDFENLEKILVTKRKHGGVHELGNFSNEAQISRHDFLSAVGEVTGSRELEPLANAIFGFIQTSAVSFSPPPTPTSPVPSITSVFRTSVASSLSSTESQEKALPMTPSFSIEAAEDKVSWAAILNHLTLIITADRDLAKLKLSKQFYDTAPKIIALPAIQKSGIVICGKFDKSESTIVVGRRGEICFLGTDYSLVKNHYVPIMSASENRQKSSSSKTEVTSCSFFGNGIIVLGTSTANIHFVKDFANSGLNEILRVTELPAPPSSIRCGTMETEWFIVLGTTLGSVYLLRSSISVEAVIPRSSKERSIMWKDLIEKLNTNKLENNHYLEVKDVFYHPPTNNIVSCSLDPKRALVIKRAHPTSSSYAFSIAKGVRAMAIEWDLHMVATVCGDGRVRAWNPYVITAPLLTLPPSCTHDPPVDVLLSKMLFALIVCYADMTIGIWCIERAVILQSISLKMSNISWKTLLSNPLSLMPNGVLMVNCGKEMLVLELQQQESYDARQQESISRLSDISTQEESEEFFANSNEVSYEEAVNLRDLKELKKIKSMIHKGSPFCCLPQFTIKGVSIPPDLPLPSKIAGLVDSSSDPNSILQLIRRRSVVAFKSNPK